MARNAIVTKLDFWQIAEKFKAIHGTSFRHKACCKIVVWLSEDTV